MIGTKFLPIMIGIPSCKIAGAYTYNKLLVHSVKRGCLPARNRLETVEMAQATSKAMT